MAVLVNMGALPLTHAWLPCTHILVVGFQWLSFILIFIVQNHRNLKMLCYATEVDATQGRMIFLDGGAIFTLPMFYLEGKFCILASSFRSFCFSVLGILLAFSCHWHCMAMYLSIPFM